MTNSSFSGPSPETLGSVSAEALRDFYLSFRFSQGDQTSQPPMFDLMAANYAAQWPNQAQAELITSLPALGEAVLKLQPPQRHALLGNTPESVEAKTRRELSRRWQEC